MKLTNFIDNFDDKRTFVAANYKLVLNPFLIEDVPAAALADVIINFIRLVMDKFAPVNRVVDYHLTRLLESLAVVLFSFRWFLQYLVRFVDLEKHFKTSFSR